MDQSDIVLNVAEKSDIKIKVSKKEKKRKKKELQRTKKWREQRRGNWTGSQLKALMSCGPGKSKLAWDNLDRLFSFGVTSLKYIYENAKERDTGRYIDDGDGSWAMQYGTKVEPLIAKRAKEIFKEMNIQGKMKPVGYKKFPNMPKAGVSSDSIIKHKGKTIATVEMKACTNWGTHYERTFDLTDEKSKDFWQIIGQTMAHEVDICYYVVAEPPSNIKDYLFHDGSIMDLYDKFVKECKVTIETVKATKIHQDALMKRITIAESALKDWLKIECTGSLKNELDENIAIYEEQPLKLERYITKVPDKKEVTKEVLNIFAKKNKTATKESFEKVKKKVLKKKKKQSK